MSWPALIWRNLLRRAGADGPHRGRRRARRRIHRRAARDDERRSPDGGRPDACRPRRLRAVPGGRIGLPAVAPARVARRRGRERPGSRCRRQGQAARRRRHCSFSASIRASLRTGASSSWRARAPAMAGDHSDKQLGEAVRIGGRSFTVAGIYHSGDRFEDLGDRAAAPHGRGARAAAGRDHVDRRDGEARSRTRRRSRRRLERRYPGVAAITEPGHAIKVDTSSRLIVVDRLGRVAPGPDRRRDHGDEHDGDVRVRADTRDRHPARGRLVRPRGSAR